MDTQYIKLGANAKLVTLKDCKGKVLIDQNGRLALSVHLELVDDRYHALVGLGGAFDSTWIDTWYGAGDTYDRVDLEIDSFQIEYATATRALHRELPVGTLAVTERGVLLFAQPLSEQSGLLHIDLQTRTRSAPGYEMVTVLNGWRAHAMRGDKIAFSFGAAPPETSHKVGA